MRCAYRDLVRKARIRGLPDVRGREQSIAAFTRPWALYSAIGLIVAGFAVSLAATFL